MEYEENIDVEEFTKQVIALMKKERMKLIEAGFDVDFMIHQLEGLLEDAVDAKAKLDIIKRQLLKSYTMSKEDHRSSYMAPTEHLDMATTKMRSDEDVIEYFKRLRRHLKRFDCEEKNSLRTANSN